MSKGIFLSSQTRDITKYPSTDSITYRVALDGYEKLRLKEAVISPPNHITIVANGRQQNNKIYFSEAGVSSFVCTLPSGTFDLNITADKDALEANLRTAMNFAPGIFELGSCIPSNTYSTSGYRVDGRTSHTMYILTPQTATSQVRIHTSQIPFMTTGYTNSGMTMTFQTDRPHGMAIGARIDMRPAAGYLLTGAVEFNVVTAVPSSTSYTVTAAKKSNLTVTEVFQSPIRCIQESSVGNYFKNVLNDSTGTVFTASQLCTSGSDTVLHTTDIIPMPSTVFTAIGLDCYKVVISPTTNLSSSTPGNAFYLSPYDIKSTNVTVAVSTLFQPTEFVIRTTNELCNNIHIFQFGTNSCVTSSDALLMQDSPMVMLRLTIGNDTLGAIQGDVEFQSSQNIFGIISKDIYGNIQACRGPDINISKLGKGPKTVKVELLDITGKVMRLFNQEYCLFLEGN